MEHCRSKTTLLSCLKLLRLSVRRSSVHRSARNAYMYAVKRVYNLFHTRHGREEGGGGARESLPQGDLNDDDGYVIGAGLGGEPALVRLHAYRDARTLGVRMLIHLAPPRSTSSHASSPHANCDTANAPAATEPHANRQRAAWAAASPMDEDPQGRKRTVPTTRLVKTHRKAAGAI